jgi:hypothetical protein
LEKENKYQFLDDLPTQLPNENNDSYGAIESLSLYCGYKKIVPFRKVINWHHGWCPDYTFTHPILAAWVPYYPDRLCLVGKKYDKEYLTLNGYDNVIDIGLPVVYTPEIKVKRSKGSLLVMPLHTTDDTGHSNIDFNKYVNEIKLISKDFSSVVICLHPSCIQKGYWLKEFESEGFKIIEGIDGRKTNALLRLKSMLSKFEYVTTNGFGSHIVYASYFGAKVSIYGSFSEYTFEDLAKDKFYDNYQDELKSIVNSMSKLELSKQYPFLFVANPIDAQLNIDWGKYEVGESSKKSKDEIKTILGWTIKGWIKFYLTKNGLRYLISELTPLFIKKIYFKIKK